MATARFAWGIDIGNRALKAIKLQREGDGLKITDFEVIEHEQVLSAAGDNRDALIQSALSNFVQRHPVKGGVVAVGVSGQQSFARFIKLPPVESKKIPEIVRFEAIQQIPFPLDDVEWSYQLFQAPDSPEIEVGIFAMRKELVNQHIKYFTDVEMDVQTVQMNPLAVYNAMLHDGRLKGTTLIVDMGAENTDLVIADADTVWLRSIPIGGNSFTEALVKAFKLNFAKAEDLKRNAATSKYARQIFQAMRPIFADLVAEIQRSIGFYTSVHRESRIKKIIALGGTFRLTGLQKYLQQNLQLEVERVDSFSAGAPPEGRTAGIYQDNLLAMVGAYGLALQAMGEARITSSLLPAHIRRAKLWQDKTKWFAAAAGVVALGTAVAYGRLFWIGSQNPSDSAAATEIARIKEKGEDLSRRYDGTINRGRPENRRIFNINSMADGRDLWPRILQDILSALPRPQDAVATALGSADPAVQAAIKSIPRASRNLLILDDMQVDYRLDVRNAAAPSGQRGPGPGNEFGRLSGGGPGNDPEFNPSMGPGGIGNSGGGDAGGSASGKDRGFVVSMTLSTPLNKSDGVRFFSETFRAKLNAASVAAKARGYEFTDPEISAASSFHETMQRLKDMPERWNKVIDPNGPQPPAGGTADPMLPDEAIDHDTEFKVHFKVILVDKNKASETTANR